MLYFSDKTNLLEQSAIAIPCRMFPNPHLYRSFLIMICFQVPFHHRLVPMEPPGHFWVTIPLFGMDSSHARLTDTVGGYL